MNKLRNSKFTQSEKVSFEEVVERTRGVIKTFEKNRGKKVGS
jgi:hypothetical protein